MVAVAISEGKFDQIAKYVPNSISEIWETAIPMIVLQRDIGEDCIIQAIEFELIKTASNLNVDARLNLQDHQVPLIARLLYDQFKSESLEDFVLCLRKGGAGFYDQKLLRLDAAVIVSWMQTYLEEKYSYVEVKVIEVKKDEKENTVDYKAFIERMAKKESEPDKLKNELLAKERNKQLQDMMYVEQRKGYVPDQDKAKKAYLKNLYIKENFHPNGKRKDEWISETDWLLNQNL
jgi:hypothetical protein